MTRKFKGFIKPIKYIWSGKPNTTKTELAKRSGLSYFETDSLKYNEVLDISKYPLSKEVFIVGGRHYHLIFQIINMLVERLKDDYEILLVHFAKWGE